MVTDSHMFKLKMLEKETNYIRWQQIVKAYLRKNDYPPVSWIHRPEVKSNFLQTLEEKRGKAKSIIFFTLTEYWVNGSEAV